MKTSRWEAVDIDAKPKSRWERDEEEDEPAIPKSKWETDEPVVSEEQEESKVGTPADSKWQTVADSPEER